VLVSKLHQGIDIRRYGTGNIGASNVFYNVGFGPAAITGVGVFCQGVAPAGIARLLNLGLPTIAACALGSVIGYGWSIFLGFNGGRGVGIATGAVAGMYPLALALVLPLYAIGYLAHQIAVFVLLAFLALPIFMYVKGASMWLVGAAVILLIVLVLRRLEGITADLKEHPKQKVIIDRLLFDRRPGQRLKGPRTA